MAHGYTKSCSSNSISMMLLFVAIMAQDHYPCCNNDRLRSHSRPSGGVLLSVWHKYLANTKRNNDKVTEVVFVQQQKNDVEASCLSQDGVASVKVFNECVQTVNVQH